MRKSWIIRAAVFAGAALSALAALTILSLPPPGAPAVAATFEGAWPTVRGAYHVHSRRSDGTGTLDEIAAAAAAAGLQFVIVTDHGDGTSVPEPPAYRSGVLCIDGVEISTAGGHYVALGLTQSPYPLGGQPRAVIEDVSRLGGFGFAAHPGSPKVALRWHDWDAPFDGIEWLNADSEWRDEFWGSLGRGLLTYAFRPAETLVSVLDRPEAVLKQWDHAATRRRVAALAGADAHARLGFRQGVDPYQDYVIARMPSYEVSFRAFSNRVLLERPLTSSAATDAALILGALREGRAFTVIDGAAGLSAFEARAESGQTVARPGEYLDFHGPVFLYARIVGPPGTALVVRRDGEILYEAVDEPVRLEVGVVPGVYRIEAVLPQHLRMSNAPWVLANPFYVGVRDDHVRSASAARQGEPVTERRDIADAWRAEASPGSISTPTEGANADGARSIEWRFSLAAGARDDQYSAVVFPIDGLARYDRLVLRGESDAPRRLWAQLRVPGGANGERWGATFYLDSVTSAVELPLATFTPLGAVTTERPPLDRVDSMLLVVDTLNTAPGTSGHIRLSELSLAR